MEREDEPAGPARSRAGGLRAAVSIVVVGALGLLVAYYAMASTTQHPTASPGSRTTPDASSTKQQRVRLEQARLSAAALSPSPKDPHFSPPGAPPTPMPPTTLPTLRFCGRSDIRGRYAGGGDGGQTHFGAVVWNVSATPCWLDGRPHLCATLDDGRPDRAARPDGSQVPARVAVALPARTPPFVDRRPTPGRYLYAGLGAPGFTTTEDCQDAGSRLRWTAPRTFTLRIARLSVTVADVDRSATENRVLAGCDTTILLEGVRLTG